MSLAGFSFAGSTNSELVEKITQKEKGKGIESNDKKGNPKPTSLLSFFSNPNSKNVKQVESDDSESGESLCVSSKLVATTKKEKLIEHLLWHPKKYKPIPEIYTHATIEQCWYKIPKNKFSALQLESLKQNLTLIEKNAKTEQAKRMAQKRGIQIKEGDKGAGRVHRGYKENDEYIWIYKYYGLVHYGRPKVENPITTIPEIPEARAFFKGTLSTKNPPQQDAIDAVLQAFEIIGGALLVLPCGFGKTICALYLIHHLRVKTMVCVHNQHFVTQWTERIKQFLPNITIGYMYGTRYEPDADIVICMIQSLTGGKKRKSNHDSDSDSESEEYMDAELVSKYPRSVLDSFGLVIIDEAHHTGAVKFSKAPMIMKPKYMLGLTATPNRQDNMTELLTWSIGPVAYQAFRSVEHVEIHQHIFVPSSFIEYRYNNDMCMVAEMANDLIKNHYRNQAIVSLLYRLATEENRYILVIAERVQDHLMVLEELFQAHCRKNGKVISSGLFTGQNNQQEREMASTCQVIFASYGLATEGVDIPRLDTLVMASPRKECEQVVGRILRPCAEKNVPRVYDFIDPYSLYNGMHHARYRQYKEWQYTFAPTVYHHVIGDTCIQTMQKPEYPALEIKKVAWDVVRKRQREKEAEIEFEKQLKKQRKDTEKQLQLQKKEQEKLQKEREKQEKKMQKEREKEMERQEKAKKKVQKD